jgi:hypothetical protein
MPSRLQYVFLNGDHETPVIISDKLFDNETGRLVATLEKYRSITGYSLKDLKGISLSLCTHRIPMEPKHRPIREHQRRLNNVMREIVKNEVLKPLNAGVIYPIFDSEWVYAVQVVLTKGGMMVICNEKNQLIPQRLSPVGRCASTTRSSTKLLRNIISRYPSLMKCLRD